MPRVDLSAAPHPAGQDGEAEDAPCSEASQGPPPQGCPAPQGPEGRQVFELSIDDVSSDSMKIDSKANIRPLRRKASFPSKLKPPRNNERNELNELNEINIV